MGDTTQKQQAKINKHLRPYAQQSASWAGNWGQGADYMGMSDTHRQSLLDMQGIARQGQASQPFMQEYGAVLGGDYLSPDQNPYFQDVVGRAVSAAGRGPTANAAGGGRMRSGAFANALADAQMATSGQMYSDQYNRERGNMQQMMGMAPMANQMQYADQGMIQDVEGQFQREGMSERDWELQKASMMNSALSSNPLSGLAYTQGSTPFDYAGATTGAVSSLASLYGAV